MVASSEVAILGRVIEPDHADLSPDAARSLLRLDFKAADKDRMSELAGKAAEGTLEPGERDELNNYVQVGHLLALLQSKARLSLRKAGDAA